jgi:hypothetical protein
MAKTLSAGSAKLESGPRIRHSRGATAEKKKKNCFLKKRSLQLKELSGETPTQLPIRRAPKNRE